MELKSVEIRNKARIPLNELCQHTTSRLLELHKTTFIEYAHSSGAKVLEVKIKICFFNIMN